MNNPRIYNRPSREWARYQRAAHKLSRTLGNDGRRRRHLFQHVERVMRSNGDMPF